MKMGYTYITRSDAKVAGSRANKDTGIRLRQTTLTLN